MNERYDQDMLLGYIEGELTDEQRAAFEQQLAGDDRLRRLVEKLRADREALRSLPAAEPPRDLLDDATFQLEREMLLGEPAELPATVPTRRRSRSRVNWTQALTYSGLAAAVLICAGVIFVALSENHLLQQSSQYTYRTDRQQRAQSRENRSPAGADQRDAAGEAPAADSAAPAETDEDETETSERAAPAESTDDADAPDSDTRAPSLALARERASDAEDLGNAEETLSAEGSRTLARRALGAQLEARRALADEVGAVTMGRAGAGRPVRVEVASMHPAQTRHDLFTWASRNDVRIVDVQMPAQASVPFNEPNIADDPPADMNQAMQPPVERELYPTERQQLTQLLDAAAAQRSDPSIQQAPREQLVLRMRTDQVDSMVAHLNRVHTQRAFVTQEARVLAQMDRDDAARENTAQAAADEPSLQVKALTKATDDPADRTAGAAADALAEDAPTEDAPAEEGPAPTSRAAAPEEPADGATAADPEAEAQLQREVAEEFDYLRLLESQLPMVPTQPVPDAYAPTSEEEKGEAQVVEVSVVIDQQTAPPDTEARPPRDNEAAPDAQPTQEAQEAQETQEQESTAP
ncbi:MAG: hypothetical protein ACODAQ_09045 [Phycisphaeraceae bacterium]